MLAPDYVHIHTPCITSHTHTHTQTDSCSYKLEKGALKVSEVFQLLDSVKSEIGILDWGIKMTTLEDGGWSLTHTHACTQARAHTHSVPEHRQEHSR